MVISTRDLKITSRPLHLSMCTMGALVSAVDQTIWNEECDLLAQQARSSSKSKLPGVEPRGRAAARTQQAPLSLECAVLLVITGELVSPRALRDFAEPFVLLRKSSGPQSTLAEVSRFVAAQPLTGSGHVPDP